MCKLLPLVVLSVPWVKIHSSDQLCCRGLLCLSVWFFFPPLFLPLNHPVFLNSSNGTLVPLLLWGARAYTATKVALLDACKANVKVMGTWEKPVLMWSGIWKLIERYRWKFLFLGGWAGSSLHGNWDCGSSQPEILIVKKKGRRTSGQRMDLGWYHLRKDGGSHSHGQKMQNWAQQCASSYSALHPHAKDTAKHPAPGPEVPKVKPVFKRGAEELHWGLCLRLSRISRDSCRVLKVRTLIYHGFKRVSGGVLCW